MDSTSDSEEDDDPTASSSNSRENDKCLIISDDILFLCFEWLFAAELSRCMVVNKHWNEAAKDNHLWQLHCYMCFNRVSSKNLQNKYSNSYYLYYRRHNKLRFDGIYILKVLYYIQSEAPMPNLTGNAPRRTKPYTTVEYYRYIRFFNNKCKVIINDKSHKIEKIKSNQCGLNAIYSLSKKKPSEFALFDCFGSNHISHKNIGKNRNQKNGEIVASFHEKLDGITTHEKVFAAKYDIADKRNVKISIITDYGLKLELILSYYEVIEGASNRLNMVSFDGIILNGNGDPIETLRDHYDIRHEPFIFIPDARFNAAQQYFD